MELLLEVLPALMPIALAGIFFASLPTGIDILRRGNDADPLRREIEEENAAKERSHAA